MRLWPAGRGSPQAIKLTHGLPTQSVAYRWPMRPQEPVGSPPVRLGRNGHPSSLRRHHSRAAFVGPWRAIGPLVSGPPWVPSAVRVLRGR
jgi:hypothetical protein